jgi:hypothetical protein
VWISAGGAAVLLFSVFFSWYTISVKGIGSASASGWSSTDWAKLVFLLALIALAAWIIELFVPTVTLPAPASLIAGAAGVLAVLIVLFRILSKPGGDVSGIGISVGTSWGIWLALLAAIAVVVGAYLRMNEG